MNITNRVVESYLSCKYKALLTLKGERGKLHDYELLMNESAEAHGARADEALLHRCKLDVATRLSRVAYDDLKEGRELILDCAIETDEFRFHFDALRKTEGRSSLGSFHYQPVLYCQDETCLEGRRTALTCGGFVLAQLQRVRPPTGLLVVGEKCRLSRTRLTQHPFKKAEEHLNELRRTTISPVSFLIGIWS